MESGAHNGESLTFCGIFLQQKIPFKFSEVCVLIFIESEGRDPYQKYITKYVARTYYLIALSSLRSPPPSQG